MLEENNEDLFASLDIADALDDPFSVKDGTYQGVISNVEIREGDKQTDGGLKHWKSMIVDFTSSDPNVNTYQHWFGIPSATDTGMVRDRKRSSIKGLLSGLEIPESRMNTAKPTDLIGIECAWTVRTNKKGFKNITVYLPKGSPVGKSTDSDSLMADIESLSSSNRMGL